MSKTAESGVLIDGLRTHPDGPLGRPYLTAYLLVSDTAVAVSNRYGSWMIEGPGVRQHVLPYIAVALEAAARRHRRAEARNAKVAA